MAAPSVATVKAVATMKCGLPFGQAVMRGVLCNWLVVMGIWQVCENVYEWAPPLEPCTDT